MSKQVLVGINEIVEGWSNEAGDFINKVWLSNNLAFAKKTS